MIKKYEEFCNEEINLRKALIGGALVGGALATAASCNNKSTSVSYNDKEVIGSVEFKEYDVNPVGWVASDLYTTISNDGVISTHFKKGKHSSGTVTVNVGVDRIYYDEGFSYIYSSSQKINDDIINLSDLEVVEDRPEYKILYHSGFINNIDYILVNKGYKETDSNKIFKINGEDYSYVEYDSGFLNGVYYFVVKL